jgi:hypothetical protein
MGSKKYIHYGHTVFRRERFCPIMNPDVVVVEE